MRLRLVCIFILSTELIFGQINLHSYQSTYAFCPAIAGIDSSSRTAISYSHNECNGDYLYADISFSTHIKQTRYGISGYFKMFDYFAGIKYFKPTSSFIAFSSIYKIKILNSAFYLKPAIETGFSHIYMIGELINDNNTTYIINARDDRFRYSSSFVLFNDRISAGLNFQGINRPVYKASKPSQWLPQNREFGISFSNLFVCIALKKDYESKTITFFLTSADRFPYIADQTDHYWSIRRVGFSYAKTKFLFSGSFGLLNNNARFKEYKSEFIYHLGSFDFGLKLIYCDEPSINSPYILQSGVQSFPMTNATIINYSVSYHFRKQRSTYSNWASVLVF